MDDHGRTRSTQPTLYVLDTNVLIHDPNALLNFQEHHVAIPITVLEELDKLKTGKHTVAAEWRQAIRLIDNGARFIATNPDVTGPSAGGNIPATGAVAAMINAA